MANGGCRDCKTCTLPLAGRWLLKLVYVGTGFFLIKRPFFRCCPQCHHLMGRHERRVDGSFRD